MRIVLVTGGTGLIGSNICTQLLEQGVAVRALARDPRTADAQCLQSLGVELIAGDISDLASVERAVRGSDGIIHSAAMLGRPGASMDEGFASNVLGSAHVFTAAARNGGIPVMHLLTSTFFDMWEKTLTEFTNLDLQLRNTDPYSITKRFAFTEGATRVAAGQDIRFMIPGAAIGSSPCIHNAMIRPSFNDRIASALRGELHEQIPLTVPFTAVSDCARVAIAGLERGAKGERYIAMGNPEDVGTISETCNRACRIGGVGHRVRDVPKDQLDSPPIVERYGVTMTTLGKRTYPTPFFDSHFTQNRLGCVPTPLDEALRNTIDWMREHGLLN